MKKLIEQLNQFREHVNQQLILLDRAISTSSSAAPFLYTNMQDYWLISLQELQTYVNTLCKPFLEVLPTSLTDKTEAVKEAQAPPLPNPNPKIAILTNQVKELQTELDKMCAARAAANPSPPYSEESGYFPGLEGFL
ncbi:hypothetical protein DSO57_1003366 [Entomophthora muscae]|uniref:Uncharacterized protein n=1 Tax=Entomophthora muscae TaxID=34485 RepID=A0ACC2SXU3_9FUNG|nr:hypothetical protein DSO57_1003366 [Entomophthora muscae]